MFHETTVADTCSRSWWTSLWLGSHRAGIRVVVVDHGCSKAAENGELHSCGRLKSPSTSKKVLLSVVINVVGAEGGPRAPGGISNVIPDCDCEGVHHWGEMVVTLSFAPQDSNQPRCPVRILSTAMIKEGHCVSRLCCRQPCLSKINPAKAVKQSA
jgi:hypothetical protein